MRNKKSIGDIPYNIVSALMILSSYNYYFGFLFAFFVLIKERDNEFVRFYAKQTIILSFISLIKYILLTNLKYIINLDILLNLIFIMIIFKTAYEAFIERKFIFKFIEKIMEKLEM